MIFPLEFSFAVFSPGTGERAVRILTVSALELRVAVVKSIQEHKEPVLLAVIVPESSAPTHTLLF